MTHVAPPLDQPHYGAPLGAAVHRGFAKYATFRGRASRSEYWWWVLFAAVVGSVLNALPTLTDGVRLEADGSLTVTGPLGIILTFVWAIWAVATVIPTLAVLVRRLHDTRRSGWGGVCWGGPAVRLHVTLRFMVARDRTQRSRVG